MSIIIKGLDLPSVSDTNGFINLSIDCYGQVVVHNTYPTKILKAEQIPKHGRLIDVDEADDYAYDELELAHTYLTPYEAARAMQKIYQAMPTIIKAEVEE